MLPFFHWYCSSASALVTDHSLILLLTPSQTFTLAGSRLSSSECLPPPPIPSPHSFPPPPHVRAPSASSSRPNPRVRSTRLTRTCARLFALRLTIKHPLHPLSNQIRGHQAHRLSNPA
ncbi:hypothetical protein H2248_006467 [Termitomyces sp. 'cryptogamus']|nr:hypothetical protein H2248_006467 [Termitomyces sp. 'cryptogamus']